MKLILKLEQTALFLLSIIVFYEISNLPWYFYAALFFVPDISFVAYALNSKIGAVCYNLLHHQGIWIMVAVLGYYAELEWLFGLGVVFVGHAAFDRLFGYGLKYSDSFQHTHLGYIGNQRSKKNNA